VHWNWKAIDSNSSLNVLKSILPSTDLLTFDPKDLSYSSPLFEIMQL